MGFWVPVHVSVTQVHLIMFSLVLFLLFYWFNWKFLSCDVSQYLWLEQCSQRL